jgi:hypothetical protein
LDWLFGRKLKIIDGKIDALVHGTVRPMRGVAPMMDMVLIFQLQGKQGEFSLPAGSGGPGLCDWSVT